MKIAMAGAGYVGLVSGACLADFGHDVVCIDKDPDKIDRLRAGEMPIFEPGLADLVRGNAAAGRLSFTTSLAEGIAGAAAIFIAVGTPSRRGDGHADLSYVYAVAEEIGQHLDHPAVIVTKSTVPVGTGDEVERIIGESGTAQRFAVASNPEFLREGAAIGDFKRPDRIVIGSDDEWARDVMREVYRPLFLNRAPIVFTSRRSAEMIKYAANAFLATKITFINEIADLCEKTGADVQDVARGIGLDNRIGAKFLHAGPGYGGSCFPKDTLALLKTAEDFDSPLRIVEAVAKVNDSRKRAMGRKVIEALGENPRGKKVAAARPDLQAQHRRHARRALDRHRPDPGRRRRGSRGLRSRRHGAGAAADARSGDEARRLCGDRRRRRGGHRHRMGRLPRARFRPHRPDRPGQSAGRPAQHLRARGSARAGSPTEHWPELGLRCVTILSCRRIAFSAVAHHEANSLRSWED